MSKQAVKNLFGRAIYDDAFRSELSSDFRMTVKNSGYDLIEEEILELEKVDFNKIDFKIPGKDIAADIHFHVG